MHELANEGTGSCRRIFTKRMLKPTMQRASRISKGKKMIERAHIRVHEEKANQYASREDFHKIFSEDTNSLYQLSLLLTRDSAKAEQCFVSGLEDCVAGNSVFREWARSWAKRAIIQNAIRELKPARQPIEFTTARNCRSRHRRTIEWSRRILRNARGIAP